MKFAAEYRAQVGFGVFFSSMGVETWCPSDRGSSRESSLINIYGTGLDPPRIIQVSGTFS